MITNRVADPDVVSLLGTGRYVLLRSFRRDGRGVDTPVFFALEGSSLLFRTKVGPKSRRMAADPRVELQRCNFRGHPRGDSGFLTGRAKILSGAEAQHGDDLLRARFGWRYNLLPLVKVPGVASVHTDLSLKEKLHRARQREVWSDSVIVRVDLDRPSTTARGSAVR